MITKPLKVSSSTLLSSVLVPSEIEFLTFQLITSKLSVYRISGAVNITAPDKVNESAGYKVVLRRRY